MDKIVEVAEQFYKDLYSSGERQNNNAGESSPDEFEIQPVTAEEVKKALETVQKGESSG